MSNELLGACAHLQMPPSEKAVLMSLADQANADGVSWPSVGSLAEYTCLSERTVQRMLQALRDRGLLTWRYRRDDSNVYTLAKWRLLQLKAERDAARMPPAAPAAAAPAAVPSAGVEAAGAGDALAAEGCHGVTPGVSWCHPRGVTVSPQGCHGVTQTINTLNTNTPHTPQPLAGGQPEAGKPVARKPRRETTPAVGLATWLAQLQAAGEVAIPEGDPVYGYCDKVGVGRDLLLLCWREFKRRSAANGKRQRDWRQTFRNCVQANWYGLWAMRGDEPAFRTSKGEQVARFFDAEDRAEQEAEGQKGDEQ